MSLSPPTPIRSPDKPTARTPQTPSIFENSPLHEASARVASASFVVAALSGLLDHLDAGEQLLKRVLSTAFGDACDELIRTRKILRSVREITRARCPYCGAPTATPRRTR